jgi:hypothetical protein
MEITDVMSSSTDHFRARIAALESRIEGLMTHNYECTRKHQEDIARIGDRLIQEAKEREWCNIYDDFVADLNDYLHIELPARRKMHKMTMTFTVTVATSFQATPGDEANEHCRKLEESFRGLENYLNEPSDWDFTIEQTSTNYDLED